MLEDIIFPEVGRIHRELWVLFQLWVPGYLSQIGTKFDPIQEKLWHQMLSTMKIEEYGESECSGIFRVKLVPII